MKTKCRITIQGRAKVLLLEDSEERISWFLQRFASPRNCEKCVVARTADEAISYLALEHFDFVFLDHDLGIMDQYGTAPAGNGKMVAKFIASQGYIGDNVVIHSWNPDGAAEMKNALRNACVIPFGQFEIEFE